MNTLSLRRTLAGMALAVGTSALAFSCGGSTEDDGDDSSTHWLDRCDGDADCGSFECVCGVCTEPCSGSSSCPNPAAATCAPIAASGCGEPATVCVAKCGSNAECTSVRSGLSCTGGQCLPVSGDGGTGGSSGGTGGSIAGGSGGSGGASGYRWYYSCGDPVCGPGGSSGSGAPACTTEEPGAPCTEGATACDNGDGCGVLLVCATSDPTMQPGGCPISRAHFKEGIHYVSDPERAAYARQLLDIPLATYRYREGASDREHLGFIIDDIEPTIDVAAQGDRVDLYGYASLAVAAIQEQQKQIDALRAQVADLTAKLDAAHTVVRPSDPKTP